MAVSGAFPVIEENGSSSISGIISNCNTQSMGAYRSPRRGRRWPTSCSRNWTAPAGAIEQSDLESALAGISSTASSEAFAL